MGCVDTCLTIISACVCDGVFFFLSFLYFEREKASREGAEREMERENPKQALSCPCRVQCGTQTHETLMNREIMTGAEIKSQSLE